MERKNYQKATELLERIRMIDDVRELLMYGAGIYVRKFMEDEYKTANIPIEIYGETSEFILSLLKKRKEELENQFKEL